MIFTWNRSKILSTLEKHRDKWFLTSFSGLGSRLQTARAASGHTAVGAEVPVGVASVPRASWSRRVTRPVTGVACLPSACLLPSTGGGAAAASSGPDVWGSWCIIWSHSIYYGLDALQSVGASEKTWTRIPALKSPYSKAGLKHPVCAAQSCTARWGHSKCGPGDCEPFTRAVWTASRVEPPYLLHEVLPVLGAFSWLVP